MKKRGVLLFLVFVLVAFLLANVVSAASYDFISNYDQWYVCDADNNAPNFGDLVHSAPTDDDNDPDTPPVGNYIPVYETFPDFRRGKTDLLVCQMGSVTNIERFHGNNENPYYETAWDNLWDEYPTTGGCCDNTENACCCLLVKHEDDLIGFYTAFNNDPWALSKSPGSIIPDESQCGICFEKSTVQERYPVFDPTENLNCLCDNTDSCDDVEGSCRCDNDCSFDDPDANIEDVTIDPYNHNLGRSKGDRTTPCEGPTGLNGHLCTFDGTSNFEVCLGPGELIVSKETHEDTTGTKSCCLGVPCIEVDPAIDCVGDVQDGMIIDTRFYKCKGDVLETPDTNNPDEICCFGEKQLKLTKSGTFSYLSSESFICYLNDQDNIFAECCGKEGICKNLFLKDVGDFEYVDDTKKIFAPGTSLFILNSYDVFTEQDTVSNKARKISNTVAAPEEQVLLPVHLPNKKMDWSDFENLVFDLWYSENLEFQKVILKPEDQDPIELIDVNQILDIGYEESPVNPIPEIFHRYYFNIESVDAVITKVTFQFRETSGLDYILYLDNLALKKSDAATDWYCSGNYKNWLPSLTPTTTPDPGKEDEFYAPYKEACIYNWPFFWTGTKCCGYDSAPGVGLQNKEFYADSEGGCFGGIPVMSNNKVSKKMPGFHDNILYYVGNNDLKFYSCGFNWSDEVYTDAILAADFKEDSRRCDIVGTHFCSNEGVWESAFRADKDIITIEELQSGDAFISMEFKEAPKPVTGNIPARMLPKWYNDSIKLLQDHDGNWETPEDTERYDWYAAYVNWKNGKECDGIANLTDDEIYVDTDNKVLRDDWWNSSTYLVDNGDSGCLGDKNDGADWYYMYVKDLDPNNIVSFSSESCCPANNCWDGYQCIKASDYMEHSDVPPIYMDNEFNTEQDKNKIQNTGFIKDVSNFTGYRCILDETGAAHWKLTNLSLDWNNQFSGYCINSTQCYIGSADGGSTYYPDAGDKAFCVNDTAFVGEYYCDKGSWSSSKKIMANYLLSSHFTKEGGQSDGDYKDYILHCGRANETTLGDDLKGVLTNSQTLCVLRTDDSVLVSAKMIQFSTIADFLTKLDEEIIEKEDPDSGSFGDDFTICDDKGKLGVDNKAVMERCTDGKQDYEVFWDDTNQIIIFGKTKQDMGVLEQIWNAILDVFRSLFDVDEITVVSGDMLGSISNFDRLYKAFFWINTSMNKTVDAYMVETWDLKQVSATRSEFVFVHYENVATSGLDDLTNALDSYAFDKNVVTEPNGKKIVFSIDPTGTEFDFWQYLAPLIRFTSDGLSKSQVSIP